MKPGPKTKAFLTYKGKTRSLLSWSKITGTNNTTIAWRQNNGWTPAECLFGKK